MQRTNLLRHDFRWSVSIWSPFCFNRRNFEMSLFSAWFVWHLPTLFSYAFRNNLNLIDFDLSSLQKRQKKRPYNLSSFEMSLRKLLLSRNCWPCNKTPIAQIFHVPFVSCAFINWIVWFFTNFRWRNWRKMERIFFIEFYVRCQFLSYLQKMIAFRSIIYHV